MNDNDNRKWLYNTLKDGGYDMGSYDEFDKAMNDDENTRRWCYDRAVDKGIDMGSYEEYTNAMSSVQTTEPTQQPASPSPQRNVEKRAPRDTYQQATNGMPVYEPGASVQTTVRKPMKGGLEGLRYQTTARLANKTPQQEVTPSEKHAAHYLEQIKTLTEDLDDAYAERERLNQEIARRAREIDEANQPTFAQRLAMNEGAVDPTMEARSNDPELSMLYAAQGSNEKRIKLLERDRDNPNYFQTVGKGVVNPDTWFGGFMDLKSLLTLSSYSGEKLEGAAGEAQEAMLRNKLLENEARQRYGSNDTRGQRWGDITAQAIPFVAEFLLTGGGYGFINGGAKAGTKLAAKAGANKLGTVLLKGTGMVADDITRATLMANTTGAGKTASDILERHMGELTQDENGEYVFKGGKSLGRSVYEGEVANTLEYLTELAGTHLDVLGKAGGRVIGKGLEKMGAGRVNNMFMRMSQSQWNKLLGKGGLNDYPSEVLEEELNIVLNSLLVGDNKFSDLLDARTQGDIIGGMALSIGAMRAPGIVAEGASKGYNAAQYYHYKHNTDKSDAVASVRMTPEKWEPLRERIDGTTNEEMQDVISDIISTQDMSMEQKQAAMDYVVNLMKMRGYNIRSMAAGNNNEGEGNKDTVREVESEAWQQGYESDAQGHKDIAIALSMEPDNAERKAAWEGVQQRIEDDADAMVAQERESFNLQRNDDDGSVHPATMTIDGQEREVFIKSGLVTTGADGSIDIENSGETIVVYDPVEGKNVMVSPQDLGGVGEVVTAEQYEAGLQAQREAYVQQQQDAATGRFNPQPGQQIEIPEAGTATVLATDGESVTLQMPDGTQQSMSIADIQSIVDAISMEDYRQRHPEAAVPETADVGLPGGLQKGVPEAFEPDMDVFINEDGQDKVLRYIGRARLVDAKGKVYEPDEEGNFLAFYDPTAGGMARYVNTKYKELYDDFLNKVVGYKPAEQQETEQPSEPAAAVEPEEAPVEEQPGESVQQEEEAVPAGESAEAAAASAAEVNPMPMKTVGTGKNKREEEDWYATTPERAYTYLYEEAVGMGLPVETADNMVANNLKKAQQDVERAKTATGSVVSVLQKQNAAKAAVEYWEQVKKMRSQAMLAAAEAEAERTKEQRAAEAERAAEIREQRRNTEAGQAGNTPAEKYNASEKVVGNKVSRTIADKTKIRGHYVLVEADALTPSHDPFNGWKVSKGFPTTEDGKSVNDRVYENDKEAQDFTESIALVYDGQAVSEIPVVSSKGIVYDGNGRTMAGQIAARNNTDAEYIEALMENAANFGFTEEQVQRMSHPRVVMQVDEDMPYNATTFARFNKDSKKKMNNVNKAVSIGKQMTDSARDAMLEIIDRYGTIDTFFGSEVAAADVVNMLVDGGFITQQEVPAFREKNSEGKMLLSADGRSFVTNTLLGTLFDEEAIRRLGDDKGLQNSLLRAIPQIAENRRLGDYALTDEINTTINLLYEARKSKMTFDLYKRQGNLVEGLVEDRYEPMVVIMADLMSRGVDNFRDFLSLYNQSAAADAASGGENLFGKRTKEDLKNAAVEYYKAQRNGQYNNQPTAVTNEGRVENTETQSGVGGLQESDGDRRGEPAASAEQPAGEVAGEAGGVADAPNYQRHYDATTKEIEDILNGVERGNGVVVSPEMTEAIQKIADMEAEAEERLEDNTLSGEERARVQAQYDAANKWMEEHVRSQKGDGNVQKPTKEQKVIVRSLVDLMNEMGVPAHLNVKEGQAALDKYRELARLMGSRGKKKTTSETAKLNSPEGEKAYVTVVSDAESGAKVRKKLDTLAKKYEEKSESPRTLLKDIAEAVGAKQRGSGSKYVTIEAQNGNIVTVRLANHNASVRNFDNNGEPEGVSIVVAGTPNNGIENNGDAHVVEFFYRAQDLRSAEGKPLVDIIRSVDQMLYSGEYKDTTGLAQVQEVNADTLREMRAYHGSGADFDAFDHSHMGEGEGAQVYGYGTYVTEVEGIGRTYAEHYGKANVMMNGVPIRQVLSNEDYWDRQFVNFVTGYERTINELKEAISHVHIDGRIAGPRSKRARELQKQKDRLLAAIDNGEVTIDRGGAEPTLYTVEIPDDNGHNYVDWTKKPGVKAIRRLIDQMSDKQKERIKSISVQRKQDGEEVIDKDDLEGRILWHVNNNGWNNLYDVAEVACGGKYVGNEKSISDLLHSAGFVGVKYPAEYQSGGRSDGAKNYVIFDEGDLKIVDKVKFFKTPEGEVYGFTLGGEIYIDPRYAKPETPVHEYIHLWAQALRDSNPTAWARLKEEMKGVDGGRLWDYVKRRYPELANEDDLVEEVFAHYGGKRGGERLEADMREEIKKADGVLGKAQVANIFHKLRELLNKFWTLARDLFAGKVEGVEKLTAEDFADMALGDLMNGFNPSGKRKAESGKRDAEYMAAVERGDMETAQRMVDAEARRKGYISDDDYRMSHTAPNGRDGFSKSIADPSGLYPEDLYGPNGARYYGDGEEWMDRASAAIFRRVHNNPEAMVRVYRAVPKSLKETKLRNGDLISINRDYAKEHGERNIDGGYKIIEDEVPAKYVYTDANSLHEQGYDDGNNYAYQDTKNNRKLIDTVTYDDNGNVIPLSKRFDKRNADARFQKDGNTDGREIPLDDLEAQRDYLLSDNYVSRLDGTEFGKSEEPLTKRVADYYKNNYDGKIDREGVGTILLDERSVKDSIGHGLGRNKSIAFAAVPDIIRRGAIIDRQSDWKGRGYGSVTFAAPIEIAGEGYVGIVVANEVTMADGTHRFYLHEVTLQKNLQSEEFKTGIDTGSKLGDVAKVLQKIVSAKNNLQTAENNDVRYQKSGTYTTKDGVQLSMESLFEESNESGLNRSNRLNGQDDGDLSELRLRKLAPGETCLVERRYEENKMFSFTGSEKIESMDDVAYIFKQLEDAAVENVFLALVKDGKPTVVHIGMGTYAESSLDFRLAFAAYKDIQPDAVYVIHNHPSGALKASRQDRNMLYNAKMYFGNDVVKDGIIIDTVSGKYGVFGFGGESESAMPKGAANEVPVKTYEFSKQVFSPEWKPMEAEKLADSESIAEFVSSHRLGKHPKMSFIVVNNQLRVVGNYFLPWTNISEIGDFKAAADEMSNYIHLSGGTKGVLYGNYQYKKSDKRNLQKLAAGMKSVGTPLLDMLHIDVNEGLGYHSAYDSGVMEPEKEYEAPRREAGEDYLSYAKRIVEDRNAYDAIVKAYEAMNSGVAEAQVNDPGVDAILNDGSLGMREKITAAAIKIAEEQKDNIEARNNAVRAIGGNLMEIRKAMNLQKEFDKGTVKRVADLARVLVKGGYLAGATNGEMSRILSIVKNATGKSDISGDIRKMMEIMVDSQLRRAEGLMSELESIKGSKVDAKGVEVQGKLDIAGQQVMKTFKETRGDKDEDLSQAISEAENRMASDDAAVAEEAANVRAGLILSQYYEQNIHESKVEERKLREELDDARHATDRSLEFEDSLLDAIQQNRVERLEAYNELMGMLVETLQKSVDAAKEFNDAAKKRVREIQHNANSDMAGRPAKEHYKPRWKDKMVNNSFVEFMFSPLATFDQMLRLFGSKSANGEGYIYNRFMRGWVDAREKEIRGVRGKYAVLDEKVKSLFGNEAKNMADLIRLIGKRPKTTVLFKNGGELKEHKLTQSNLMYIYMVNKMLDGRMKLRKMGIDEKEVSEVMRILDPRLLELADWMQEEFLVDSRNEYNETHKRIFGAPMAAIEHYFPLKINPNAREDKAEDLDDFDKNEGISTKTGSIIKRRRNSLALDILNADALNVILDHVAKMEHWNAFAEFNRDLNTLRTYAHFRNQVKNMTTIYGSGDKLWEKFNDLCQMAAGTYRPKRANLDVAATNVAKGVTAAKVSFRIFTALKQFLSMPAYLPDARPDLWAKNLATPWNSWSWAMENLPIFEERWKSRMAGDPRLLKSELDWKGWRNNVVQMANKIGMSPNAFVDALTVSIGAKTIYESRKARYLKEGYSEEQAEKRAKQDAEIAYNQTQQSSEGAFLSTMQVDRSWLSVMFTVFRNSSMAYQRQLHDALRNLKRDLKKGNRAESIEFMAKQMVREGVEEEQAKEAATARYDRQVGKDALRVATFGFIMQFCWNLGAYLPYLLFGDDDDKKSDMWDDIFAKSMFGWAEGLTGGDVFSEAGKMAVKGEGNPEYLKKEMPLTSDAYKVLQEVGQGKYGEVINDMVNLVVQAGIGVNPQSITDAVLAIMDACGNDPELAHEATIAIMRILQVPQSQIKEMYFDEVGLSGEEVSNYTPDQLAERYARYQVKRGRLLAPWTWDDSDVLKKKRDAANKAIKERLDAIGGSKVNKAYEQYEEQYKDYDAKVKEYQESSEYKDANYNEQHQWINEMHMEDKKRYITYMLFPPMDKTLDQMAKYYLSSTTPRQAQTCHKYMEEYKQAMIDRLDAADNKEQRDSTMAQVDSVLTHFRNEFSNIQPTTTQGQNVTNKMNDLNWGIKVANGQAIGMINQYEKK